MSMSRVSYCRHVSSYVRYFFQLANESSGEEDLRQAKKLSLD
jgi:hypothetical protein